MAVFNLLTLPQFAGLRNYKHYKLCRDEPTLQLEIFKDLEEFYNEGVNRYDILMSEMSHKIMERTAYSRSSNQGRQHVRVDYKYVVNGEKFTETVFYRTADAELKGIGGMMINGFSFHGWSGEQSSDARRWKQSMWDKLSKRSTRTNEEQGIIL